MAEKFLSVKDLAERYDVPEGTVRQWNSRRTGPRYVRVGIYCRYRERDVLAWERANEKGGEAAGARAS